MPNDNKRNNAHYIHRLSYTTQEQLVGVFVLAAIALLAWLLITSQKTQNLFEEHITLYGSMDSIRAVEEGTNIIISGLNIGTVSEINIDSSNNLIITMRILKKYQKLIRTDSVAELLSFKFALLGKSFIEISAGSPELPVLEDGSTLSIKESLNLGKLLAQVEPVIHTLHDSINRMNEILNAIEPKQISQNIDNLQSISDDLKVVITQINKGKGLAGSVIYNEDLQKDVLGSAANLKNITDKTLILVESLQQRVDEIPELTEKVKPLLDEADKTLKATQNIWPLSGSMPEDTKQTLTSPVAPE